MVRKAIVVLGLLGLASAAAAKTVSIDVTETAVIENNTGDSRVLLKFPIATDRGEETAIARALLKIPASASDARGRHKLCAFPITTPWNSISVDWDTWLENGGDIDRSRGSWITADLNAREIILDVTNVVAAAMRHGESYQGILLCPLEGSREGFGDNDLNGISFEGAQLSVTMREIGHRRVARQ